MSRSTRNNGGYEDGYRERYLKYKAKYRKLKEIVCELTNDDGHCHKCGNNCKQKGGKLLSLIKEKQSSPIKEKPSPIKDKDKSLSSDDFTLNDDIVDECIVKKWYMVRIKEKNHHVKIIK